MVVNKVTWKFTVSSMHRFSIKNIGILYLLQMPLNGCSIRVFRFLSLVVAKVEGMHVETFGNLFQNRSI